MRSVKAIVIGGSNSLMKKGYVSELPAAARAYGVDLDVVRNLSVGNTTCLMGLINLKSNIELVQQADLLIVEYALNDASAFGEKRDSFERWLRTYEAVVRFARTANPDMKIILAVLGEKKGSHRVSVASVHAGVHYLAQWYGVVVRDVNMEFVKRFGRDFYDLPGAYQDPAHYAAPIMTRLVAEIITADLPALMASEASRDLPPKIDPATPDDAQILDLSEIAGTAPSVFSNSFFTEACLDLGASDISLTIEGGRPIGIKYVCQPNSPRLFVECGGQAFDMLTLRPSVQARNYKFLVAALATDTIPAAEESNDFLFTIRNPGRDSRNIYQFMGRAPDEPENRLAISSILYTGVLKSVSSASHSRASLYA